MGSRLDRSHCRRGGVGWVGETWREVFARLGLPCLALAFTRVVFYFIPGLTNRLDLNGFSVQFSD